MTGIPTMHLVAGVNGAGKTSFYYDHLRELAADAEFVNADEIAHARWPGAEPEHNAEAAAIAVGRRRELLERGLSFVTETVFSHASKLELIREAKRRGYCVLLYHIGIDSSELAVARVVTRVEESGHDVPLDKILSRFERCQKLIPQAAEIADVTRVYDNSGRRGTATHTLVMRLDAGRVTRISEAGLPRWASEAYEAFLDAG